MSFRFHKGPSLITLFHDKGSPTSNKILNLLSTYNARRNTVREGQSSATPANTHGGETDVVQSQFDSALSPPPAPFHSDSASGTSTDDTGGGGRGLGGGGGGEARLGVGPGGGRGSEYLREAAEDPLDVPFEFEVLDRTSQPPTPDQMRSILDYLGRDPTPPTLDSASATTAAKKPSLVADEERRRRQILQAHLDHAKPTDANGLPRIKEGPLVVLWDEGYATTTVEGVQAMLQRIDQQQRQSQSARDRGGPGGGGGCTVM